jgi:hypothetical protein
MSIVSVALATHSTPRASLQSKSSYLLDDLALPSSGFWRIFATDRVPHLVDGTR